MMMAINLFISNSKQTHHLALFREEFIFTIDVRPEQNGNVPEVIE
jgi:hypothetical protein